MRRRGFTLVELMIVVAILGTLAALTGGAIAGLIRVGLVNGGADSTARLYANARLRSVSMRCPVYVQMNGPTFAPATPPVGYPARPSAIFVMLKGNCQSTNMFFEGDGPGPLPDDRVIAEFNLDRRLRIDFPSTVLPGGTLAGEA
ncbi:MAG: prepilin-type N-terminal cleavage/methylation domain-containing protein, partial [Myxococcaceae bacterium]|nr:prepilin-type N-terminal cleavage/methylation domain-containing protein [Myxococcaceae bacterium]